MNVSTSILIDAPAEDVWEVIGPRFTRVSDWVSAVASSEPTGAAESSGAPAAGRACRVATAGFDQIAEELTAYEPEARRLSYRMVGGMPSFVADASNTWQARTLPDGRTEFTMDADVAFVGAGRFIGPLLRAYLSRVAHRTSRDLKTLVETGAPSRAKTIQTHASRRTALDWLVLCNAAFSAFSGATLAVTSSWWSRQFGEPAAGLIATVGVGLVGYGVLLAWAAGRGVAGEDGRVIASIDAAWVAGTVSVLALAGATFAGAGVAAAVLSGVAVAALGALQWCAAGRVDTPHAACAGRSRSEHLRRRPEREVPAR